MSIEIVGEPVEATLFAGGMDGPKFFKRRKIVLTAYVQDDGFAAYVQSEEACVSLGEELGRILHAALQ